MTGKDKIKERKRIQNNSYKAKKYRETRDEADVTNGFVTREKVNLVKRENFFIQKEHENYENPPNTVSDKSLMFILSGNPQAIQVMKMWYQKINTVPYYRRTLDDAIILD